MSFFPQNSHFDRPAPKRITLEGGVNNVVQTLPDDGSFHKIATKHLEDWSFRLQSAANEAGDEQLSALESDLLDVRDEIVFALHEHLQSATI